MAFYSGMKVLAWYTAHMISKTKIPSNRHSILVSKNVHSSSLQMPWMVSKEDDTSPVLQEIVVKKLWMKKWKNDPPEWSMMVEPPSVLVTIFMPGYTMSKSDRAGSALGLAISCSGMDAWTDSKLAPLGCLWVASGSSVSNPWWTAVIFRAGRVRSLGSWIPHALPRSKNLATWPRFMW